MPELPEVETVRRGLEPVLVGRRIARAQARRPDLRFPLPQRFTARLKGARIERLDRRAKYLLAPLDTGEVLIAHLGMSGRFAVHPAAHPDRTLGNLYHAEPPNPAHTHVVFETDRGDRIEYNDPRRFGYMNIIQADEIAAHPYFRDLGPEPLGNSFNAAHLAGEFKHKTQNIKAALLDQRVVAGLGNIYVCEALFRTRINPQKEAGAVSKPKLEDLTRNIRDVLNEAIAAGGSTLRDYAQTDGALGYFQHRFKIYDREGQDCSVCGKSIARIVQSGRSTFFCPKCQR